MLVDEYTLSRQLVSTARKFSPFTVDSHTILSDVQYNLMRKRKLRFLGFSNLLKITQLCGSATTEPRCKTNTLQPFSHHPSKRKLGT